MKIRRSKIQLIWQEINLWNRVSFIDLICKGSIRNYSAILLVFTFLIVIPSYLYIYGVTGSGATDYNNNNNKNENQNNATYTIGNKTLVVWQDNSNGNNEIYLRVSTDGGNTFGNTTNLSNNTGNSEFPKIDSVGKKIIIVWQDNSTGNNEIYLRKSKNAGATFSSKIILSNNTGNSEFPQIDTIGNKTLVVWQDNSNGNNEIYLRVSTDGGNTFGNTTNLSNNTGNSEFPKIDSVGKKIIIVWQDNSTGNNEIYLRESADGGNTFIDLKNRTLSNIQYSYPKVLDADLKVERVTSGIKFPTHMAFLAKVIF